MQVLVPSKSLGQEMFMSGMERYRPQNKEAAFTKEGSGGSLVPGGGEQRDWNRQDIPHEQMVEALKGLLEQERSARVEKNISFDPVSHLGNLLRSKSTMAEREGRRETAEYFSTLGYAWDAITFDHHDDEGKHFILTQKGMHTVDGRWRESITLQDEKQVALLDAMAGAVGIPHMRGQRVIPLPHSDRSPAEELDELRSAAFVFVSPLSLRSRPIEKQRRRSPRKKKSP